MAHSERDVHIVIAAYCEQAAVGETVRGLRTRYPNVVVVDDGSPDRTADQALEAGATVLRHVVNRGQGAALQTGIAHALRGGARYVVTFDADGQHAPADLPLLLEPLRAGRCDVVLGSRFLRPGRVPLVRKLVLKAGVLFTRIVSGIRVTDTHNGLRAFSREAAERIEIRLDRMAHASELLDQIGRSGLRWVEVPVEVRYTAYSKGKGQSSLAGLRIAWDFLWGRWSK